jgi:hypothetical protein
MSRKRGRMQRVGETPDRLRLLPPVFVEAPPGRREHLLAALRALFRDQLEERLACGGGTSVDGRSMPGEGAQ